MVEDLTAHLPEMNKHQAVWVQGSGGKSFCAGGDVKVLFQKDSTVEDRLKFFRTEFILDYKMSQLQAVQISCWDGIVMGGGVGLSVFAPIIIATEKTVFAMPETKLGFYTDVGANFILSRLRSNIGYYLGMTGTTLKG
jgi:3-hydroxyisobutyryl-CoA hydrolase